MQIIYTGYMSHARNLHRILGLLLCLLSGSILSAQVVYPMQNALVRDCEGVLTDSEMGEEAGQYAHNEDYTFTVCVDDADEIIVAFEFFATENNHDVLTVYDGPDRNSPVLATLSGILQPPPTLVATSGCITFHFRSDDNIAAIGWRATWTVQVNVPTTPRITAVTPITCPLSEATFRFDIPVDCDLFTPGNFTLLGPGGSTIEDITLLDCDPVTGLGRTFTITFDPALGVAGSFRLIFNGEIIDACGRRHDISTNFLFQLANCPLNVYIDLVDGPQCSGDCARFRAVVTGGNPVNYRYRWSLSPLTTEEIQICSDTAFTIRVDVTDAVTGEMVSATYDYVPLELPVILNPVQDTICASAGNHQYLTSLPGGSFYSQVIPDHHRQTGVYEFWRWAGGGVLRTDTVTYIAPNGCRVRDTLYILPINVGGTVAVCTGTADFQINATPTGGAWSGPHISPTGSFSPSTVGSFVVTYTAPNGCTANKRVNVADQITITPVDTLCSAQAINLQANPGGGQWSGPGIVNASNGRLEAWQARFNQVNTYTYTMIGCQLSIDIYIKEIYAGPDIALCTDETTMQLFVPGDWSGPGIFDPVTSTFDISALAEGDYHYTLTENGCSDVFTLYLREARIEASETPRYCPDDTWIPLSDRFGWSPWDGGFSGTAIGQQDGTWYFNPGQAGPGTHMIYFEWLGCRDSLEVIVEEPATFLELSFCERSAPVVLTASPPGGSWSGPGFLDESIGLFDPQLLPVGSYDVVYTAPTGCRTTALIEIFLYEQVRIGGFQQQYCYRDTSYGLTLNPAGGRFFLNGAEVPPQINPALLGPGSHELYYTRGTGACASADRKFITILEPIRVDSGLENDSICAGQFTEVAIFARGGLGNLTYTWDGDLGFGNSQIVSPGSSTWYRVRVTDNCSDPLTDSVYIHVYPSFGIDVASGPSVCYEDSTFAEVIPPDPDGYAVRWLTNPPVDSTILLQRPGSYLVEVTQLASGCRQRFDVQLPGAPPIKAHFSLIPYQDCIDIIDNEIEIIDLSIGGDSGGFDFGDGSPFYDMAGGGPIRHIYRDTGSYTITQYVENSYGCRDSFSRQLCVRNLARLFVPDAFSPNEDDVNDRLQIFGFGIDEVIWRIYDRYGSVVFESRELTDTWDGTHKGRPLAPDVFIIVVEYKDRETGQRAVYKSDLTLLR